nr:protein dispatched 1 [Hymenolepis microstoma]
MRKVLEGQVNSVCGKDCNVRVEECTWSFLRQRRLLRREMSGASSSSFCSRSVMAPTPFFSTKSNTIVKMGDIPPERQGESVSSYRSPRSYFSKFSYFYARWLVSHPIINSILITIFLFSTVGVSLYFSDLPYFDDPTKDFITMGTTKAAKLYQLKALQYYTLSVPSTKSNLFRPMRSAETDEDNSVSFCFELPDQGSDELWSRFASMSKIGVRLDPETSNETFLTTRGAIQSLCKLQKLIEKLPGYSQLCSKGSLTDLNTTCCPIWSLPNFITSIAGKSSCEQITSADINLVQHLYTTCWESFLTGSLKLSCWDESAPSRWLCPDVPSVCFIHPHLLLLLAISGAPRTALFVLPIWRSIGLKMWYLAALDRPTVLTELTKNLTPSIRIEAIELGEYGELSARYVVWDSVWVVLGAATLVILLSIMTRGSFIIVIATFLALGWSLLIGYGLYSLLLLRHHDVAFPLLNMMALVLILGLGADDILLFYQVWVSVHSREVSNIDSLSSDNSRMATTLIHAVPSVCLTSFSTLGGLLMSLNSSIVAVKRFALYSSLTVLCHIVYVLVVMPTLLYLLVPPHRKCCSSFRLPLQLSLANFIVKIRYIFPLILFSIIITSSFLLFYAGWLSFPSGSMQPAFYRPNHPSEVYRLYGGEYSWAESTLRRHRSLVSLHAVWGVVPKDPRNPWTWAPQDDDNILLQPLWSTDFSLTDPRSIEWLSNFCSSFKKLPRILTPPSVSLRKSYLEEDALLFSLQNTGCAFGSGILSFQDFEKTNPFCVQDKMHCLVAFAEASSNPTGLRFSLASGEIVGLVISFVANISLSNTTFSDLHKFGQEVEKWFSDLLITAPSGLNSGFIVSPEFTAFETYEDVLQFLPISVGFSITLAALLVFLSTMNLPLSLTALTSVISSLLLSCLLLVILGGWNLGIVEALILSLSAGLAVDPCIHLAFAMMKSKSGGSSWKIRSCEALQMVGSAVTGAALSTALAGAAVLPSQLKCYQQMGLFLLILMTSALLLCGVGFVGSAACLPDRFMSKCWNRSPRQRQE